jgi:CheY-like chemotaxis protein
VGDIVVFLRFRFYALALKPNETLDRARPVLERLGELSPVADELTSSRDKLPSPADTPSSRVQRGGRVPNRWSRLDSRLIFVIDDDETTRALTATFLRLEGYRVRTAGNGREALALLVEEIPCALVVDLRMPVMDGAELRRRQRSLAPAADVPFVVISGMPGAEDAAAALGATAFLAKPFDNDDLKIVLERVCA